MGSNFTFSQVPRADIPRSSFNRSHGHKTTFDAGQLIPVFVDEALPGDTFQVNASVFARLTTPIVPFMDNLHIDVFFFAVPNRLLWEHWQEFMGEQKNPGDSTDYLVPHVKPAVGQAFAEGSLADYFGIPIGVNDLLVTALPFRAYNLIWNEWFRDQNLQDRAVENFDDADALISDYPLRYRGKRHDYFTSCLPWPQKGPGVELPLGTNAPVTISGTGTPQFQYTDDNGYGHGPYNLLGFNQTNLMLGVPAAGELGINPNRNVSWSNPELEGVADLTNATAATINSLRQAFQIQKLLERDARGGTRYIEILKAHFGVVSPDYRLQRPEFLGGGSVPVNVNPVTQTSETATGGNTPQGNLAAYAVAGSSGLGFSKSFTEHSVILGLVSVRADLSYQKGLHKMWQRRSRYDFYWPAFAHLGEQAVLNNEIYCDGSEDDQSVFGYQERWAEYRYFPSKITGKFRSDAAQSLDVWHLAEDFGTRPALNAEFIESKPPVDRVVAVPTQPHFLFDSWFTMKCTRPMPVYSVPGLIDHF